MSDLAQFLADFAGRGHVVAPAGFGKTHLIAQAVGRCNRRQLVLTHTYAGVNVLRKKLRNEGVPPRLVQAGTIAGFALRLCLAYPKTSKYADRMPTTGEQWASLYAAATRLLGHDFARKIVTTSYSGVFVDEYQDCSVEQHHLICALAATLPCRLLGDPLQAIFDFPGQSLVNWETHVQRDFPEIGRLETPHRWINSGSVTLGAWLSKARDDLWAQRPIDLSGELPATVRFIQLATDMSPAIQQMAFCRGFHSSHKETVVAMHGGDGMDKNRCHGLARKLSGQYASIEEVEGHVIFGFIVGFDKAKKPATKLKKLIEFAKLCMTAVEASLAEPTKRGEPLSITPRTKNPRIVESANAFLAAGTSITISNFLTTLKGTSGVRVFRADLFNRLIGVLRKWTLHPKLTFQQAAERYHTEFRHIGRPVGHRRLVATTLLVKGLEFDHAIVLDATSLTRRELYVAMSRGSRSLTILSTSSQLNPIE